jgi:hypothetical protein
MASVKNSSLQIVVQCGATLHLQAVAAMASSSSSSSSSPQKIDFVDGLFSWLPMDPHFRQMDSFSVMLLQGAAGETLMCQE